MQLRSNCGFIKEKCQSEYHHRFPFLFLSFQFLFSLSSWWYLLSKMSELVHFFSYFQLLPQQIRLFIPLSNLSRAVVKLSLPCCFCTLCFLDTQALREKRSLQSLESVRDECQRQTGKQRLTELLWQTSGAIESNLMGYKDGWGGKEERKEIIPLYI